MICLRRWLSRFRTPATAALAAAVFLAFASLLSPSGLAASTPRVVVLHLDDTIQPISEDYLSRGIARAADTRADALLVTLNTPGGLLDSTREMVSKILASPVPVIVYVAPSGSRAGSAGFFLLEAADIAAMAPGTNAGASHPVIEGAKLDPIMKQKLENDTTAFLRSFVSRRGRNVDAAQDAVLNSKSYTEREALQLHLLDTIAPDEHALLNAIDGRTITRFDGRTQVLHTRDAILTPVTPSLREQILDRLMDPNLAVLILVVGGLLIYLEFNAPGTIIPGALGTLLLLLALFALNLLPVHYTSMVLILGAFALMILEAKVPSHGILAGVGIIALVLGTLTLVDAPIPELRVHVSTAIATGVAFGFITTFLVRLAVRARNNKVLTGPDALIGGIGIAQEALAPRGQILVHGELWFAESATPVAPGEHVRVRAVNGLTLLVERIPDAVSSTV
ncbi:NfeD family protein [Paracidobacterium acidisoli]|uniref:Nodulation protein NfeD n=1 Tax=Paracidobacterium acidisoli TaxID=2303751 RepID=A0A372IKN4_9BACT|nr:nodulation protein NfeD [Paracidobacterium acidisoli]MBT9333049.1 nodulation protein NfeD [Paracidobacterium acidisoli]